VSPLVRAGIAAAVLAAVAAAVDRRLEPTLVTTGGQSASAAASTLQRPCPAGMLLDNRVCVPAPAPASPSGEANAIRNWQIYDRLPRRPDRPSDPRRYRWPAPSVAAFEPSPFSAEGAVALDALMLDLPGGTPVTALGLEQERGKAAVLYTGPSVGQTVVTEHHVLEGTREQIYLVLVGNLGTVSTRAGARLEAGAPIGTVGDSARRGLYGLHVEVRRLRQGEDARALGPDDFRNRAHTIACDARNVLRLEAPR
jgi:hypothetical protein